MPSSHVQKFRPAELAARCDSGIKPVENPPQNEAIGRFEDALRQIMQVSKEDLKKIQAEEEAEKADKPKKRGPKPKNVKGFNG